MKTCLDGVQNEFLKFSGASDLKFCFGITDFSRPINLDERGETFDACPCIFLDNGHETGKWTKCPLFAEIHAERTRGK